MILHGHINPTWDNSYKLLNYKPEILKDPKEYQRWLKVGHPAECLVINTYSQPQIMPQWAHDLLLHWPQYRDFGISFHKFNPGQYFPDHVDIYGKYREKFNVEIKNIIRILVYLEDWYPGQINTMEDLMSSNWKAGDWIGWTGETRHGAANFGDHPRYALTITCHQ